MSKRHRSTFRRGGVPFGVDGRNKVAIAFGRRQSREPPHQTKDEREAEMEFARTLGRVGMEAEMRAVERALLPALGDVLDRVVALGDLINDLRTAMPKDVAVEIIGFDSGHGPDVATEVLILDGEIIGLRVLPNPKVRD